MTKTIAVSNRVYKKLKELKEAFNLSYSELLERLVESYERSRLEALRRVVERSKLPRRKGRGDKEVSRRAEGEELVGAVLDTSVLMEILDTGNTELLDAILAKYGGLLMPWVALYEYLYGHAYVDSDVQERKRFIEELGTVVWLGQKIVLKALDLDVGPSKVSLRIPFSDLLIAATALEA